MLAKFLTLNEVYSKILDVPGNLIEIGSWLGQSSIIFENLRAIHEPFNNTRRIVSFDTFDGYREKEGLNIADHEISKYKQGFGWEKSLSQIQECHRKINGSVTSFNNVVGDVSDTLAGYLGEKNEPVALAYYDIATYQTAKITFEYVSPYISKGGAFIFDDFGPQYPGVSEFIHEAGILRNFKTELSRFYKSKLIVWF